MLIVAVGQAGALVATIAVTKVLTSNLGEQRFGQFALAMTGPMLLQQFVFGPASQAALRFYPEHASAGRLPVLLHVLFAWLARVSYASTAAALALAVVLWVAGHHGWALLVPLALVIGLAQNYQSMFGSLQAAARRRVPVAIHQALEPAARAIGAYLFMRWLGAETVVAASGVALGSVLVMLSQGWWFRSDLGRGSRASAPTGIDQSRREMQVYAANFAVWGMFAWVQQASDRWSLEVFADTDAVGTYVAAFQLASVPTLIAGAALSQFIFPIAFNRAGDAATPAQLRSAARVIHIVAVLFSAWVAAAAVICWFAGTEILVLLTSDRFREGGVFLAPLAIALGLLQIGHLLSLVPLSAKALGAYRWFKIGQAILAVALNIAGAAIAGTWGVVVASIVSSVLYAAGVCLLNWRILSERRTVIA
jgi:O-antigen/teichoic acid export membrane protein